MAVDEYLLKQPRETPLLRFYKWSEPTVSFGYFSTYAETLACFPQQSCSSGEKLHYVRRWTGGGVVDHRVDWTYTLVIPRGHSLERMRGAGSYRRIHQALGVAMRQHGEQVNLQIDRESEGADPACFRSPVEHDVLDHKGMKLAGAGQRRTKYGLLHQGSVAKSSVKKDSDEGVVSCQSLFVEALAYQREVAEVEIDPMAVEQLMELRYADRAWLRKR